MTDLRSLRRDTKIFRKKNVTFPAIYHSILIFTRRRFRSVGNLYSLLIEFSREKMTFSSHYIIILIIFIFSMECFDVYVIFHRKYSLKFISFIKKFIRKLCLKVLFTNLFKNYIYIYSLSYSNQSHIIINIIDNIYIKKYNYKTNYFFTFSKIIIIQTLRIKIRTFMG